MSRRTLALTCLLATGLILVASALASSPPRRLVAVTPTSIDGTRIGASSRGLYTTKPDYRYRGRTSGLFFLTWWRGRDAARIWAEQMRTATGRTVQLGYWGPLRTPRGDRQGTTLASFQRRWPQARVVRAQNVLRPIKAWNAIIRSGGTVAVFTFDGRRKLRGLLIAEGDRIQTNTCFLPPECRGG
jgi:hypothetical protein